MLLQYSKKININGVEIYPDFDDPNQFWYIPTKVKLAERNQKKILSYIWYIASTNDSYGDGFLNFEVNTSVDDRILNDIKNAIVRQWNVNPEGIKLGLPTYTEGKVSFVALKPLKDNDKSQTVWTAGSPSLVGDNTAVCSVQFTSEGKLAAAMASAIKEQRNTLLAVYTLKYKAMTPAIKFRVKGDFSAFLEDYKVSLGMPIPLEGFILNLGIQNQYQLSWDKKQLEIELIDYIGEEQSIGIEWAKKIVFEYMLQNFFEYRLKPTDSWNPLSEKPEIIKDVGNAYQGGETVTTDEAKKASAKVASSAVPSMTINLNVSNYTGFQKSELAFMYSESRVREINIAPQSALLEELGDSEQYITQVNRRDFPFGQPFYVQVSGPSKNHSIFSDYHLSTAKVNVNYPPSGTVFNDVTFTAQATTGDNPMKFQYNQRGETKIGYSISYVFEPSDVWNADANQYEIKDLKTDNQTINAFPNDILEFFKISVHLSSNFIWGDLKRVDVQITCNGYSKPIVCSFFPEKTEPQPVKIRVDKRKIANPVPQYSYKLLDGKNNIIYQTEKQNVDNSIIVVSDQYQEHVPVTFYNRLNQSVETAIVVVHYENGKESWDSDLIEFSSIQSSEKGKSIIIPTLTQYPNKKKLLFSYRVQVMKKDGSQDDFEVTSVNPTQGIFVTGIKPSVSKT